MKIALCVIGCVGVALIHIIVLGIMLLWEGIGQILKLLKFDGALGLWDFVQDHLSICAECLMATEMHFETFINDGYLYNWYPDWMLEAYYRWYDIK